MEPELSAPMHAASGVDLSRRRALVTGGASGIGLAIARRLAWPARR